MVQGTPKPFSMIKAPIWADTRLLFRRQWLESCTSEVQDTRPTAETVAVAKSLVPFSRQKQLRTGLRVKLVSSTCSFHKRVRRGRVVVIVVVVVLMPVVVMQAEFKLTYLQQYYVVKPNAPKHKPRTLNPETPNLNS